MVEAAFGVFPQQLITTAEQVRGVSYSMLLSIVRGSTQGDQEAQNFIASLVHTQQKTILEKILCFADLPKHTDLGTMGQPTVPCEVAGVLKSELDSATIRFCDGSWSGLMAQRESRRCRATAFMMEHVHNMHPRLPTEWGCHYGMESLDGWRIRALAAYLWPAVGGLVDPMWGDTAREQSAKARDQEFFAELARQVNTLLRFPDKDWPVIAFTT